MIPKKNDKGLTLIEIIIALAILGIIVVAFLNMFTSGFGTIFSMGRRTQATQEAQSIIDAVVTGGTVPSQANLEGSYNDLYASASSNVSRYFIENDYAVSIGVGEDAQTIVQSRVTVVVFFNNGKDYVRLSTVVP